MTTISSAPAQVNSPAFRTIRNVNTGTVTHYLAEPYSGLLLEAMCNTGLDNADEIAVDEASIGNDGFTVSVGGQHVRVTFTPVPYETQADRLEALSDGQLRDLEFSAWVELQDRANRCPSVECDTRECVFHADHESLESFLASEGFPVKIR
jgi:hypothetical protein